MQNFTGHNQRLPAKFFQPLPDGVLYLLEKIAQQTTTAAVFTIIAEHLDFRRLEIWLHLQNPIVHSACAGILRQQHMKKQYIAIYK